MESPVRPTPSSFFSTDNSHLHTPDTPPAQMGGSTASQNFDANVLRRLCDDTYVPTQLWAVNSAADMPFCEGIVVQLLQLGGSSTVSKLRGALRHRICAQDNVKSVPLKALLAAYPEYFMLQGNQVSLSANVCKGFGSYTAVGLLSGLSQGSPSYEPL